MKRWGTFFIIYFLLSGALSCGSSNNSNPTPSPLEVNFISFGDWGTGNSNQQAVASLAHQICQNDKCDFSFVLGDNFYPHGVSSTSDTQWQTKYKDVYSSLGLSFYALLGNHDWDSPANPQAEIDNSAVDSSWKMPAAYYTQVLPDSDHPLLQLFIINSNDFKTNTEEQTWLSEQINQSSAKWKILAFHHPVFSNGSGHTPDEKQIYPILKPIICHKINLLLSGHDHFFSHLRDESEDCGYDQLVIGTGGQDLYPIAPANSAPATILYTEQSFGLGYFSITSEKISFDFFPTTASSSYSYQWQ